MHGNIRKIVLLLLLLILKFIKYQILSDFYLTNTHMGDFHFYQSNILAQNLYFLLEYLTFGSFFTALAVTVTSTKCMTSYCERAPHSIH